MSLAENLLNSLDETAYQNMRIAGGVPEEHIKVGQDRVITVPNSLKTIAVKGDKDIETVTFDCVRYWDGNDLSTFAIYLNYVLPDLTTGTYIPEKITTTDGDEFYHFDWKIKNNITLKSGKISFAVTAVKTKQNESGETVVDKQWSSIPNGDCSIILGIDISNVPSEEESSGVLAQMSAILENIHADIDEWIKSVLVQEPGYSETAVMSQKAVTELGRGLLFTLNGNGVTYSVAPICLRKDRVYKVFFENKDWDDTFLSPNYAKFSLRYGDTALVEYYKGDVITDSFFSTIGIDTELCTVRIRAEKDTIIRFSVVDVTDEFYKCEKGNFIVSSLSYNGSIDYNSADTLVSKIFKCNGDELYLPPVIDKEIVWKCRVSFYNSTLSNISTTAWAALGYIAIPDNAIYFRISFRPYETDGTTVKHNPENPINVEKVENILTQKYEVCDVSLTNTTVMGTVDWLITKATKCIKLCVKSKYAENQPSLNVWYSTNHGKLVDMCSGHISAAKLTQQTFYLPPLTNDADYIIIRMSGTFYIDNLYMELCDLYPNDNKPIKMSAHLGYRLFTPENTMDAYKLAARCGFDGCVANVHETSDGGLICYHQDDKRLTSDGGATFFALSGAEIAQKTTEEMLSYNAGLYMSPYYTDDYVPLFEDFCKLCAKTGMKPFLSLNHMTESLIAKIKAMLNKYRLLSYTTIRSYSFSYLNTAYNTLGDSCRYLIDMSAYNADLTTQLAEANFGGAVKLVGLSYDAISDNEIEDALSKNLIPLADANGDIDRFEHLIEKGVKEFTGHQFIKYNIL